jgi:hypothetical protein
MQSVAGFSFIRYRPHASNRLIRGVIPLKACLRLKSGLALIHRLGSRTLPARIELMRDCCAGGTSSEPANFFGFSRPLRPLPP